MIYSICSQGWYIGITAASQAVKAGSTPVPCSKKKDTLTGVFLFGAGILLCKIVCLRAGSGTRKGCRLHTITASNGEGMPGGERIQATMVFEKII